MNPAMTITLSAFAVHRVPQHMQKDILTMIIAIPSGMYTSSP